MTTGQSNQHRGHTLLEMMFSLVLLSVVMASVGSAVMFASSAVPDEDSPLTSLARDGEVLARIAEEIASAKYVIERTNTAITIVGRDLTGDGVPDRIRYAWSGTRGDPLTYELNGGVASNLIDSAVSFSLDYVIDPVVTTVPGVLVYGAERKVGSFETNLFGWWSYVKQAEFYGNRVDAQYTADALGFLPTRVELLAKNNGAIDGTLTVDLIPAGSGALDLDDPYAQGELDESDVSSANSGGWKSVALGLASVVPTDESLALIYGWDSGPDTIMALRTNSSLQGRYLNSTDGGSNWDETPGVGILYRLYGKDVSVTPSYDVTREHITAATITLQSTTLGRSPVTKRTRLMLAPQVLDAFWDADFNANPELMDLDADGVADWSFQSGSYDASKMTGGVWTSGDEIAIQPAGRIAGVVTVQARMRASNGKDAELHGPYHVDADGDLLPIAAILSDEDPNGQSLNIYNDENQDVPVLTVSQIETDWVDLKMLLLVDENLLSIWVNGESVGSLMLSRISDPGEAEVLWITGDNSGGEFAEVRVGVGGSYAEAVVDEDDEDGILTELVELLFGS